MKDEQEVNIVVRNENLRETDVQLFFGDEDVLFVDTGLDMFDVLVMCGFFQSKSEARRNWKRTEQSIPDGFTDIEGIGKLKRRLTIFNAMKDDSEV